MALEFKLEDVSQQFKDAMASFGTPIAAAATGAVNVAGNAARDLGRANIRAAGFGVRWQNTWKVNFYQVNPPKIDAAAWLFHKIPFAEIFEDGGTIIGKPFLWIPLRNAPLSFGTGKKRLSPKSLVAKGIKLFSINHPGMAHPLLATKVFVSRSQARRTNFGVTGKQLLASRKTQQGKVVRSPVVRMTVPLFFGVRAVHEKKKWQLRAICQSQVDALPGYYESALSSLVD